MSKTVKRTFVVLAIFAVLLAVLTGFAAKSFAVKAEPSGETDLVYTGEPQTLIADPGTPDYGHVIMYSLGGSCPSWTCDPNAIVATEAGTYTVCWYEGHYYNPDQYNCFTVEIAKKSIEIPEANPDLVYDGTEQIGVAEDEAYTICCNRKTDAGKYFAVATLVDCKNTQWSDGTFGPKYIEWSIAKKNIDIPTANTGLVYDGTEQTGVNEGDGYTIICNKKTNAGKYFAVATLVDCKNTQWSDGTFGPKYIEWSIAKKNIDIPTANTGLVYTGEEQTGVDEGVGYTLTDNKAIGAGEYTAIAELVDPLNTQWPDGTTEPKEIKWSIAKKPIVAPEAVSGLVYNGEEQTGVPAGDDYDIEGNTGTNAGEYGATVSLVDPDNTQWADGTTEEKIIEWKIAKATIVITPKEGQSKIYGEADPEAFEYDAEGLFGEDTIKGALGREEGENAGEYAYNLNTLEAKNYNIVMCEEPATFEIKPAQVTVTVEDKTKVEGEADPEFTAKAEGLVGEDELEYSFTREKGEAVGKYAITAEVEENPNYVVTVVDGTLTITEKPADPAKPATPGTGIDTTENGLIAAAGFITLAVLGAFAVVVKKRSVK